MVVAVIIIIIVITITSVTQHACHSTKIPEMYCTMLSDADNSAQHMLQKPAP